MEERQQSEVEKIRITISLIYIHTLQILREILDVNTGHIIIVYWQGLENL